LSEIWLLTFVSAVEQKRECALSKMVDMINISAISKVNIELFCIIFYRSYFFLFLFGPCDNEFYFSSLVKVTYFSL